MDIHNLFKRRKGVEVVGGPKICETESKLAIQIPNIIRIYSCFKFAIEFAKRGDRTLVMLELKLCDANHMSHIESQRMVRTVLVDDCVKQRFVMFKCKCLLAQFPESESKILSIFKAVCMFGWEMLFECENGVNE